MLRFIAITTISSLSLMTINTTPLKAQTENSTAQNINNVSPQKLIKLARQGRFKAQGIPSYSSLNSAIKSGKITAQNLVTAAIEENRLSQTALEDTDYLAVINNHLKSGGCGTL